MRVRENAESIAFYGGEEAERALLRSRFDAALANLKDILLASRNLSFFTSSYRFLISFLPAAVVAPLYFRCVLRARNDWESTQHILNVCA